MTPGAIALAGGLRGVTLGNGPRTFVLIHGLAGTRDNWHAVLPGLAALGRVVAIDLPGFGESATPGRVSLEACRAALERCLDAQAAAPLYLIGNSLGGTVAILEAARRPELAGLVLLDPAVPYSGGRVDPRAALAALSLLLPGLGMVAARRALARPIRFNRGLLAAVCARPEAVPAELVAVNQAAIVAWAARADAARTLVRATRSLFGQLSLRGRFRRAVAAIGAPTVVIHGAADRLSPLRSVKAVARRRPDWLLIVLEGVGHAPQLEAPAKVIEQVVALIGRAESTSRFSTST